MSGQMLLSIIIPTHRRPRFLERAIRSALQVSPKCGTEVIVVPNGIDLSWKSVADEFAGETRVRWLPIAQANACAARNYGLAHSSGQYLRFLDDDDLLDEGASQQLTFMQAHDLEICTAVTKIADAQGRQLRLTAVPIFDDFVQAVLATPETTLTTGVLYQRSVIEQCRWREDVRLYDDYIFLLDVLEKGEVRWLPLSTPVAIYRQHFDQRLSFEIRSGRNSNDIIESVRKFHDALISNHRMTPGRRKAVATAMLTFSHSAFPSSPLLLTRSIRSARQIHSDAIPSQHLFRVFPALGRHIVLAEWAMFIPRIFTRMLRRMRWLMLRSQINDVLKNKCYS